MMNDVYFSMGKAQGGISGGTIASMINLISSPWSVLNALRNPYILCDPNKQKGPTQFNSTLARLNPLTKKYESIYIMEPANVPIVLRSASILGYGKDFDYHEGVDASSAMRAGVESFLNRVVVLMLFFAPMRWILSRIMPQGTIIN